MIAKSICSTFNWKQIFEVTSHQNVSLLKNKHTNSHFTEETNLNIHSRFNHTTNTKGVQLYIQFLFSFVVICTNQELMLHIFGFCARKLRFLLFGSRFSSIWAENMRLHWSRIAAKSSVCSTCHHCIGSISVFITRMWTFKAVLHAIFGFDLIFLRLCVFSDCSCQ